MTIVLVLKYPDRTPLNSLKHKPVAPDAKIRVQTPGEAEEDDAEEEAAEKARASKARTGPNASLLLH